MPSQPTHAPARRPGTPSLGRQGSSYFVIGGIQWLLDWGVMVLLSHLGLRIGVANVAGRVCGALLGFWLNGKVTFAGDEHCICRRQLLRFVLTWIVLTLLSPVAIEAIDDVLGRKWAWLAKPLVEVGLGVLGFIASRHWIYRR